MENHEPQLKLRQYMTLEPRTLAKIELEVTEWACLLKLMRIGLVEMMSKPKTEEEDLGYIVYLEEIIEEIKAQLKDK